MNAAHDIAPLGASLGLMRATIARHVQGPVEPEPWPGHVEGPEDVEERMARRHAYRVSLWQHYLQCLDCDPNASLDRLLPYRSPEDTGQHADSMRAWLDSDAKNLVLQGSQSGRGKTYTMVAIGNEAIRRRMSAIVVTLPVFAEATRPGGDERLVELMYGSDLVGIDDMGAESISPHVVQGLRQLLNTRNGNAAQRTMVSTNLSGERILGSDDKPSYGSPVLERMVDRALIKVITRPQSMRQRVLDF